MIRLIFPLVALAVDIYALVDVITSDEWRIRNLNKIAWVFIILFLPLLGAILWFTIGKQHGSNSSDRGGQPRTVAPDDDPTFLHNVDRFEQQEARIRRLEQELAALDDEDPKK
ncbi:MAG: hypothetical protein JWQ12_1177 [Glaciihabitans sp.]|nr:hypothetical protein [Glaciihabitans sp.]